MSKDKIKKISIALIAVILLAAYICRVWYLNADAYTVNKRIYEVGEECSFNNYKYKVVSCDIMTHDEVVEQFQVEPMNQFNFDMEYIVTKLEVEYIGEEESAFFNFMGYYSSGAWFNGPDYKLEYAVNSGNNTFTKGERKEIWSFGVLPQGQFASWEWEKRRDMKLEIIFQTLPEEVRMKCN